MPIYSKAETMLRRERILTMLVAGASHARIRDALAKQGMPIGHSALSSDIKFIRQELSAELKSPELRDKLLIKVYARFDGINAELWKQYLNENSPSKKARILSTIGENTVREIDALQKLGLIKPMPLVVTNNNIDMVAIVDAAKKAAKEYEEEKREIVELP